MTTNQHPVSLAHQVSFLVKKIFRFFITTLIFLLLLEFAVPLIEARQMQEAPPRGLLTGRITERITGQPIPDVKISIEPAYEDVTNNDGRFRVELPSGIYTIQITAKNYAPLVLTGITVTTGRTSVVDRQLDILLREEVDVRSGYFPADTSLPVSSVTLNRAELRSTPGTGGDVLRVINTLPGVTNASGEYADLIVRGGSIGENLTFIDNIPVGDFTYFTDQYDNGRGGRIAVLAPDAVESLDFSSGGFGVRYGDRMSSALDIRLRKSARDRVQGSVFLDSGSLGFSTEVPIGKRGGWFFTARRSYIDIAFDLFDIGEIGRPRDFDFINKIDYDLTPRHTLSFTALNLFERFTANLDEALKIDRRVDQLVTERSTRRAIMGLTLSSTFGTQVFSQLTAWGAGSHSDGTFLRALTFNPSFTVFSVDGHTLQRSRDLRDSEFGLKEELTAALTPRLNIAAGGGIILQQASYFTFERSPAGFSPIEEEFLAPTRSNRLHLGTTASGYGYMQATWQPHPRLSLTPGVRVDRYGVTDQTLVSPRMSARLRLTPRLALNAATGLYRQPPGLFVMSLVPENRLLKAQRAIHAIAGLEWLVREDVRVTVEAYEKRYENLIVRPTLTSARYFNTGEGEARGLEVVVQKALVGRFGGEAIYSFTHSRKRFTSGGFSFPSETERPHQLTLIGITRVLGFNLAGKLRLASGLPNTLYEPVEFRPGIFLQRLARPEDRNAGRLPVYAQFDMRAERRFNFRRWSFAPYVDIFNLTGRVNNTEQNYSYFDPSPQRLSEGRALPIFGARIEF